MRDFINLVEDLDPVLPKRRGRPPLENPKEQVTVRIDAEVMAALRAEGPGWQTRMNALLRAGLGL